MSLKISIHPATDVLEGAFAALKAEMLALQEEKVTRRINVDVTAAVSIALGAVPELTKRLGEIRETLPKTPMHYVESLETYAYAALAAHMHALTVPQDENRLTKLAADAAELRATLAIDAKSAVRRGQLDAKTFGEIPTGQGRLDTARALIALGVLFRSGWDELKGRTAVTEAELEKAVRLGVELLTALGREDHPVTTSEAQSADEMRYRAYTLFYAAYAECRRAMHYLRWYEDDARALTPSLSGPKGGRPRRNEAESEGEGATPEADEHSSDGKKPA
jgi:hypothetical protein